jgi:hypothetical protein
MIRYRAWLLAAALLGGLCYLGTWRMAATAPGVASGADSLAVPLDDAAIYFQYARQALRGEWLRYSPGAPVSTGVTSPLYLLLITGCMGLGLSGPWAAWAIGMAALLLGLVCADRLGRRLCPDLPPWWIPLLVLSQGAWVGLHFNAMETGLFLGLSLALLDALTDEDATARAWGVLGLLAFTRPEGQALGLLLGGAWLWHRKALPSAGWLALLMAAPSLLLLLVGGSVVPDSVRPKTLLLQGGKDPLALLAQSSDFAMGVLKGAWMGFWGGADSVGVAGDAAARNPVGPLFPPLALAGALLGLYYWLHGPRRWLACGLLAALAALLGLLASDLPMGWHNHRYLAAASPVLLLAMAGGLQALRSQPGLGRAAAAAAFTLWAGFGLASWPWHLQRTYLGAQSYAQSEITGAVALRGMPAGPVAVADSGLLAYYSGRPITDLLGITDHALALAAPQGKGAVLEELLGRGDRRPVCAALAPDRSDVGPAAWENLGLLHAQGVIGKDLNLYTWDWSGADLRDNPGALPKGWMALGSLNVADLGEEARRGASFRGDASDHTFAARLRLYPGGPQVPEGGRRLEALRIARVPEGTSAIVLRGVFDHGGRLYAGQGKTWTDVTVPASPDQCYSQVFLPVQLGEGQPLGMAFTTGHGPDDQPNDWALYRIWFLKRN